MSRSSLTLEQRGALLEVWHRAQEQGLLGPVAPDAHVAHAEAFGALVGDPGAASVVDLGSGGGVPGLVLMLLWAEAQVLFLEAQSRRCRFLAEAVAVLGGGERALVVHARAEDTGRDPKHREAYDLVVARAFGSPAATAECAAPLLKVGGRFVVSEPPEGSPERWPAEALAALGLGPPRFRSNDGASVMVSEKVRAIDERWPRRVGAPGKRPLWRAGPPSSGS